MFWGVSGGDTIQKTARIKPLVVFVKERLTKHHFMRIALFLRTHLFLMSLKKNASPIFCCIDRGDGWSASMIVLVRISSVPNPEAETLVETPINRYAN